VEHRYPRYAVARFLVYVALLTGTGAVVAAGGWVDAGSRTVLLVAASAMGLVAASSWWLGRHPSVLVARAQPVVDLVVATSLCEFTGGFASPLFLLYFPAIASAAYLLGLGSALWVAAGGAAGTALVAWQGVPTAAGEQLVLYYELMFRVFSLFLVAALAGTLAESAARTGKELVEARRSSRVLASEHQMLVDTLSAGVVTVGGDGRVQALNPAARERLGEVGGELVDPLLPGLATADRTWEEARADGSRWVCSVAPLADGGRVVVIEDVTELSRMRERQAKDERLVGAGRVAASVAHEIRNPLASLSGALQMIAEERPGRIVQLALEEAARLDRLVDDFLASARPPVLRRQRVDLAELAREVAQSFGADRRFRDRIVVDVNAPSEAEAWIDPDRLRQVLWNLLLNAAQVMPGGGPVQVGVEPGPWGVRLTVRDRGPGIVAADRVRVFDPYYTTRTGGSGLGLAVVDQVVRAHGGTIAVRSPADGGTEFVIDLPLEVPGGG